MKVNMVLQGKGGVGKSMTASIIAQYKQVKDDILPLCIDTDPVNQTFAGYHALKVRSLEIMDEDEINSRRFDDLIELLAATKTDVVVDNGASSFVPLLHYILSNGIAELLNSMNHELIVHTVITGGQAQNDTISGFVNLVRQLPKKVQIVVWLNHYFGAIVHDNIGFENFEIYKENRKRLAALIKIPELKQETFGADLEEMLRAKLTFSEAIADPGRSIMARQRLTIVRDQLYAQLDAASVL